MTRKEIHIPAALFDRDYDSSSILPLNGAERVYFGSLFDDVRWTWYADDHVHVPHFGDDPEDKEWQTILRSHHEEAKAKTPDPRAYRVRIVVEVEELSPEESRRLIAEALERDAKRFAARVINGS